MIVIGIAGWICLITSSLFCLVSLIVETRLRGVKYSLGNEQRCSGDANLLVSILVPAFNEERVIERTVRAILSSDWTNLEVIVVDDGSSDRTAQIVAELSSQDCRVKLIRQLRNRGKANALNVALATASSDYVVVVDADTVPSRDFVRMVLGPLVEDQADAVAGNVKTVNRPELIGMLQTTEYLFVYHVTRLWQGRTNSITTIAGAAGGMKRSAIVSAGGYSSDTMAEDADLTLRLRQNGCRIMYLPNAIVHTEMPCTWRALYHQRLRWFYGNLQCIGRQLRRADGGIGIRLSGVPIFTYENLIKSLVELGRACIPLVVALGCAPRALLYAYLGMLLVKCGSVKLAFCLEDEQAPSAVVIAVQYSLWPMFSICPNVVAAWKLLTHQPVSWRKATRSEILEPIVPRVAVTTIGLPPGHP